MPVNLSNSTDIVANSLSVIHGNKVVDILGSLTTLAGSPPVDVDSLEKIASSVNNDPTFHNSVALAFSPKADQSYVDTQLATKSNIATTYSKTDVDGKLALKADTATTYSKTDVDGKFYNFVNGAPAVLNTLNSLALALNDDQNYATTMQH